MMDETTLIVGFMVFLVVGSTVLNLVILALNLKLYTEVLKHQAVERRSTKSVPKLVK